MANKYRRNGYNGANAAYAPEIDQPAQAPTLFSVPELSRWQQIKALAGEIYTSRAARLAAFILAAAAVALMFLAAQGCAGDPVARQIIQRQADYWEQDRRPIVSDADFMAMPESQRVYFLPASTAQARRFAMKQAQEYAKE